MPEHDIVMLLCAHCFTLPRSNQVFPKPKKKPKVKLTDVIADHRFSDCQNDTDLIPVLAWRLLTLSGAIEIKAEKCLFPRNMFE